MSRTYYKEKCQICEANVFKHNLKRHYQNCHRDDIFLEKKLDMIQCMDLLDKLFFDILIIKDLTKKINEGLSPELLEEPIFKKYQDKIKVLSSVNLVKPYK